jgi:hypothetical protein
MKVLRMVWIDHADVYHGNTQLQTSTAEVTPNSTDATRLIATGQ